MLSTNLLAKDRSPVSSMRLRCFLLLSTVVFLPIDTLALELEDFCGSVEELNSLHMLDEDELAGNTGEPDMAENLEQICRLLKGVSEQEPGHINQVLAGWIDTGNGIEFLKDINFKIKAFENKETGESNGLGFSYDYSKVNPLSEYHYNEDSGVTSGWSWSFSAKGNVAFDSEVNPADFSDTRFAFSGFRHKWPVTQSALSYLELNVLEDERAEATTQEQLAQIDRRQRAANRSIIDQIRQGLPPVRSYIDLNLNVGLESDQKFDQKQWTYGAQLALDFKSYNRESWHSTFNVFDWPFAVIRKFSGYNPGERFQVYGSTIPTLVLGFDQVDPQDNLARRALGEESRFQRYRAEIFFRTPIAYIGGSEIFFNFDYRFLKEHDAPASIEAAELDAFRYTIISVSSSNGLFVSYRDGKLPFDLMDQQVYELGWKFNLGQLQN